jgi:hypothetical protein
MHAMTVELSRGLSIGCSQLIPFESIEREFQWAIFVFSLSLYAGVNIVDRLKDIEIITYIPFISFTSIEIKSLIPDIILNLSPLHRRKRKDVIRHQFNLPCFYSCHIIIDLRVER